MTCFSNTLHSNLSDHSLDILTVKRHYQTSKAIPELNMFLLFPVSNLDLDQTGIKYWLLTDKINIYLS